MSLMVMITINQPFSCLYLLLVYKLIVHFYIDYLFQINNNNYNIVILFLCNYV